MKMKVNQRKKYGNTIKKQAALTGYPKNSKIPDRNRNIHTVPRAVIPRRTRRGI